MYKYAIILAAAAIFHTTPSSAAAEQYNIDSTHVHAVFFVSHLGFSRTSGQFKDISGQLTLNEEDPSQSSVSVVIQTASLDTADPDRDTHLRKADFFNVEKFPAMTFTSTRIEITGAQTANITGDLTLLGVTRPVVLTTTLNQKGEHPFSKKITAGFSATTKIKRSDYGMNYALPAVGDEVEIYIEVEAQKQ